MAVIELAMLGGLTASQVRDADFASDDGEGPQPGLRELGRVITDADTADRMEA